MKRIIITLLFISQALSAQVPSLLGEVKVGAFIPLGQTTQDIYGDALPLVAVEFDCDWRDNLSLWLMTGAVHKKGRSLGLCYRTELTLVPIAFGLRYTQEFTECVHPYLGLGPQFTHLSVKNDILFVSVKNNKWLCGGLVKSGVFISLNDVAFVDIFADFSFLRAYGRACSNPQVYANNASLNSLLLGVGFGVAFN